MTLKTQTLLKKILALRDLQLLYQTLLLKRQLLKRGGRLLLVRRLQQMRLLDHVQLQLFLQLLYRLLQLLPAQLGELVLMLQIFRIETPVNLLVQIILSRDLIPTQLLSENEKVLVLEICEPRGGERRKNRGDGKVAYLGAAE